jgi:hypothetical protein
MEEDTTTTQPQPEARTLEELIALPPAAILNPEEARIYARLKSRQAIYNWLKDPNDTLPASKKGGWKIVKRELDAYLRKRHNRRETDRAEENGASNEVLRTTIAQLVEIAQAVIAWKRAAAIHQASLSPASALPTQTDIEWMEQTYDDLAAARDRAYDLVGPLSEQTLTSLRFMLPSITSGLALADRPANGPAESLTRQAPRARSRR